MPLYLTSGNMHVRDEDGTYHDMHILTGGDKEEIITEVAAGAVAAISEDLNELKTNVVNAASTAMEQKAQEVIGDIPSDYTELSEEVDDLKSAKAPVIIDTASGDIASFPDGADGLPVKDLTVGIEPVQDLHGYDHPWPAGGGKNLFPLTIDRLKQVNVIGTWNGNIYTYRGITFNCVADQYGCVNSIVCNGTASGGYANLGLGEIEYPNGNYILSGCPAGGSSSGYSVLIEIYDGPSSYAGQFDDGNSKTVTITNNKVRLYPCRITEGTVLNNLVFYPMLRLASDTDPTYAPYSNICPISGWTGANVTRTGKNLFNQSNGDPAYTVENILPPGHYYFKAFPKSTGENQANSSFQFYFNNQWNYVTSDGTYDNGGITYSGSAFGWIYHIEKAEVTLTKPYLVRSRFSQVEHALRDIGVFLEDVSEFTAYIGTTIPISWQSEAGTVYGGTLDVTSGVLTVTHGYVDLGTLDYLTTTVDGNPAFKSSEISNVYQTGRGERLTICICSKYATSNSGNNNTCFIYGNDKRCYIKDPAYSDVTSFKESLVGTQLIYLLASPLKYSLTARQLTTLLGENNIWADCGPVSVEYPADTKLYIDSKIAAAIAAALNA